MTKLKTKDIEREELRAELLGSFLSFKKIFYPLLTGRQYIVSHPTGRESHHITLSRFLSRAMRLELQNQRGIINIQPGSGKSTELSFWVAWCFAHYADCNFMYISYSKALATNHTTVIRSIMSLHHYRYLFGVHIDSTSKAKDLFKTTAGGTVGAYGSSGSITGNNAGLPNMLRFSGAIIIDDAHKPDEVHSDTIRSEVLNNYSRTIQQRARGKLVPTIFIGQRLHEDDLAAYLLAGKDGYQFDKLILQSLDDAGNALYPEVIDADALKKRSKTDIYVFASQYQQDPQPAGGAIFEPHWFVQLDNTPSILATFITVDTAETDKSYNDATVFSFWGVYKTDNNMLALHWIDCLQIRVEPRDLYSEFLEFYGNCLRYKVQPLCVAIEKKSTGVTLISVLNDIRGLHVRDIKRTKASGSKTARFLEMQHIIASKMISFDVTAKHKDMCIEQARKITANNTHRNDDIIDTLYDAVKLALIDKLLYIDIDDTQDLMIESFNNVNANNQYLRAKQWQ